MASEAHLKSIVSEHKFLVYLEFTVQTSLCREKKVYKQDHLIWVQNRPRFLEITGATTCGLKRKGGEGGWPSSCVDMGVY